MKILAARDYLEKNHDNIFEGITEIDNITVDELSEVMEEYALVVIELYKLEINKK